MHSYVIEDADGKRRTVHANKLRAYNARVGQVGVVFEGDEDFGEIDYAPAISSGNRVVCFHSAPETRSPNRAPERADNGSVSTIRRVVSRSNKDSESRPALHRT